MKTFAVAIAILLFGTATAFVTPANAQFGGVIGKAKLKINNTTKMGKKDPKIISPQTGSTGNSDSRAENAKALAKAPGMPKAVNTDAALNKLLFQAADDHRLVPRKVVIVDKDWFITTGARNEKVRRIFAVLGRTLDDGSGKCGKQMVQFDQDWKEDKNSWGLIYVQNIGPITPIACGMIGK